jgi:hypothetical protein
MGHRPAGTTGPWVLHQGMAMSTVTRVAIADAVGDAFEAGGARRCSEILAVATSKKAPPAVLDRIAELPDRHFSHVRDLWRHMPEVPVE